MLPPCLRVGRYSRLERVHRVAAGMAACRSLRDAAPEGGSDPAWRYLSGPDQSAALGAVAQHARRRFSFSAFPSGGGLTRDAGLGVPASGSPRIGGFVPDGGSQVSVAAFGRPKGLPKQKSGFRKRTLRVLACTAPLTDLRFIPHRNRQYEEKSNGTLQNQRSGQLHHQGRRRKDQLPHCRHLVREPPTAIA